MGRCRAIPSLKSSSSACASAARSRGTRPCLRVLPARQAKSTGRLKNPPRCPPTQLPSLADMPEAPLIQLTPRRGQAAPAERKPSWLKVPAPGGTNYVALKGLMRDLKLHTVCEEAQCPNIGECWEHKAATFMILGDVCTRNCAYCAVAHGTPKALDLDEPARLAEAVAQMGLEFVVITSGDRDDLPNGGAELFAAATTPLPRPPPPPSPPLFLPPSTANPPTPTHPA